MKRKIIIVTMLILNCIVSSAKAENTQFDKYGGWNGIKGSKTGVFHTEKINNRWWIITPEGNAFWSTGMYCVRISGIPETETGKRIYKDNCLNKYGNEKEWARVSRLRLVNWGFNTIGDWSSETIYREPGIAYVIGIDLPRTSENIFPKEHWAYFPDVFSQEFRNSVRESMGNKFKQQPYLIDDPWLLGYYLADEPAWYGTKARRGSLTDDFIALDGSKAGKMAWVEFTKTRYNNINELNKSWGTKFKSFDELLIIRKITDNENTEKDKLSFLRIIADEFGKALFNTLREFDKHHMVLGTRPSRLYPEVIEALGKYEDIFSTGAHEFQPGYKLNSGYYDFINNISILTGKPLLLGVVIPAKDTKYPFGVLDNQTDRGVSYWRYLSKVASHPAVVGLHWFQYFDPPLKCYDKKAANWGVVNEEDNPYQEAVELISKANKMVYAYAAGLTDFLPDFNTALSVKKETNQESTPAISDKTDVAIIDSGFERGKSNWILQAWKGSSKASFDSSIKHSGRTSLKIQGGPGAGWESVGVGIQDKPNITLKPGYQYKISAWIKTQDVENSAFVRIKIKYKNGKSTYFGTDESYGTREWKLIAETFSPREENTVEYLGAQLVGRGTAWFDDIKLELIE
jgi:hypothetical protein